MIDHSRARTQLAALVFCAIVLAACSTSTSTTDAGGDGSSGPSDTTAVVADDTAGTDDDSQAGGATPDPLPDPDIELADDVVVVQRTKGETVKGLGDDGVSILLDSAAPGVKDLKVGSVMLLTGVGVGRVEALDDVKGDTAVTFSSVTLPEVISEGELDWDDTEIDFADGQVIVSPEMEEVSGAAVEPAAYDLTASEKVNVTIGEFGAEFEWSPSSDGGGNLKLELTPHSDFTGKITADVDLEPIEIGGGSKVTPGKVDFFDLDFANLQGKATLGAELQSTGNNAAMKLPPFFKVPISVSVPVPVAGIPFTLTFGATIQVNLSFATTATLRGEARMSFGGPAKFHYDGSQVTLEGNRTATSEDTLATLVGGGGGPVGLVLTTELPKISFGLKMLQTGAAVFVSNGMVASLTILPAPVLCHRVQASSVVAGGIDASFLGASVTFTRKAFLDKRWTYFMPKNDQRCDGE